MHMCCQSEINYLRSLPSLLLVTAEALVHHLHVPVRTIELEEQSGLESNRLQAVARGADHCSCHAEQALGSVGCRGDGSSQRVSVRRNVFARLTEVLSVAGRSSERV